MLQQPIEAALTLCLGLVAVIVGLAVFMEGLNTGLMPFGTIIGDNLPKKATMGVVLLIIGILGVGVTFAEPAIGAFQAFGASVDVTKAPYLYELLNNWTMPLVLMVGVVWVSRRSLGTIRFVRGWSLKPMIYGALAPVVVLTFYCWNDPQPEHDSGSRLGLWRGDNWPCDSPLGAALGIGIANAAGKGTFVRVRGRDDGVSVPDTRGTDPRDLLLVHDHARRDYRRGINQRPRLLPLSRLFGIRPRWSRSC